MEQKEGSGSGHPTARQCYKESHMFLSMLFSCSFCLLWSTSGLLDRPSWKSCCHICIGRLISVSSCWKLSCSRASHRFSTLQDPCDYMGRGSDSPNSCKCAAHWKATHLLFPCYAGPSAPSPARYDSIVLSCNLIKLAPCNSIGTGKGAKWEWAAKPEQLVSCCNQPAASHFAALLIATIYIMQGFTHCKDLHIAYCKDLYTAMHWLDTCTHGRRLCPSWYSICTARPSPRSPSQTCASPDDRSLLHKWLRPRRSWGRGRSCSPWVWSVCPRNLRGWSSTPCMTTLEVSWDTTLGALVSLAEPFVSHLRN